MQIVERQPTTNLNPLCHDSDGWIRNPKDAGSKSILQPFFRYSSSFLECDGKGRRSAIREL